MLHMLHAPEVACQVCQYIVREMAPAKHHRQIHPLHQQLFNSQQGPLARPLPELRFGNQARSFFTPACVAVQALAQCNESALEAVARDCGLAHGISNMLNLENSKTEKL